MAQKLVYNIEPASPSMIASLDRHCLHRVPDGASNIVPERSHLNKIIQGDKRGLMQSLKNLYADGVKKPAAQSESPYLRIVVSVSPSYFRPNEPDAVGTWDEDRLSAWKEAVMNQLRAEHGDDLVFAELHLDEDTPHIHAVVAPTYLKKARKPGKQKRGETPEQFEERKAAARDSQGVRTVGRASHPSLSKPGSFQKLRQHMTLALDHLGIEYGDDRAIDAPAGQSTREWVIQQAADLRKREEKLKQNREALERDRENSLSDALERQRMIERTGKLAAEARTRISNASREQEERSQLRVAELERKAAALEKQADQERDFIVQAESIADNHWERASAALDAEAFSEARREAILAEAAEVRQKAVDGAQRASQALLETARKEADQIKREATPERFQALEKENARLRKEVEGWENFFRSIRQTLSTLLAGQWETVRQKLNEAWKRDPKNPEYEPKPTPPSYSSGPSGP
ncbi:plasmid recombination protein [Citreicella sp. 357]|nr:plasmid recombination protein [Citreicella sp. 357]